jgi:hypothetical protein
VSAKAYRELALSSAHPPWRQIIGGWMMVDGGSASGRFDAAGSSILEVS